MGEQEAFPKALNFKTLGASVKSKVLIILAVALAAAGVGFSGGKKSNPVRVFSHTTKPVVVDNIYPSMFGPTEERHDLKLYGGSPEVVWITGYEAKMIDPNGARQSQEFMCHDTLSFANLGLHQQLFDPVQSRQNRIFTLSQGQDKVDFPEGFGIPISASENLMLQSQVLNLRQEGIGTTVSHKIETKYVADKDLTTPMKALTMLDGGISVDVLDPQAEKPPTDPMSCAPDAGGQPTFNIHGHEVTAHWKVKPGFERRESDLGRMFPIDTTAHYISVHMHNYGKSLELYDETAGKSVFKSLCKASPDGKGLASTTCYSSVKGVKVYKNHFYKVISEYDNTSGKDQTAMAFIFVYIYNPEFKMPDKEKILLMTSAKPGELCKTVQR